MARIKSEIWVKAYIRLCNSQGHAAFVVRRGDADAGAIYIKVDLLNGTCLLFTPSPIGYDAEDKGRLWMPFNNNEPTPYEEADNYIAKQLKFDSDIWLIELESPNGQHFLDEYIAVTS